MNQVGTDPRESFPKPPFPKQTQEQTGSENKMRPEPDYGETSYKGHGRLTGKVALITGADSGIGRAVALAYAREGADVGIGYLEAHDDAEQTRRVVEESGRKAVLLPGDISDPDVCRRMVEETLNELGRLDILVNNAAYQGKEMESIEELDAERLERTFRVNIMSMFHLVKAALPHLAPGSAVINVASIQGYQPSPGIIDYAATKGAIITFTKGLSQELIERGIRVNAVAPGPVWTPLIPQSFDGDHVSKFGEKSPMGRPAQPVELAPAFVYLASDESSFVVGEVIGVTGGVLLP
ncbi:MAG TPA: glucose 1-dehydrogenase [Haliangium sp.]|nr:glucose 1-dehydrogenase [Haliangium sp.]